MALRGIRGSLSFLFSRLRKRLSISLDGFLLPVSHSQTEDACLNPRRAAKSACGKSRSRRNWRISSGDMNGCLSLLQETGAERILPLSAPVSMSVGSSQRINDIQPGDGPVR